MSRMWPEGGTTRLADAALATGISCLPVRKRSTSLAGSASSVGTRRRWPGFAGFTRRGVTMIARSVSFFSKAAERNRAPRIGTSPSQGSCCWVSLVTLWTEPGDREALAVAQLDHGRRPAHRDRRDRDDAGADRVRHVDVAHLGLDLEVDHAVGEDRRLESQADAEFLVLDGDLLEVAGDRDRELAAGEEARLLAGHRDEVRLGETAHEPLFLQGLDEDVRLHAARKDTAENGAEGGRARSEAVAEQRAEVQRALRRIAEVLADGLPIDADVLACVARYLDEAHLEHDLLRAADLEVVQHLRTVLLRERDRARRRDAVVHGAGEDGAAVCRGDAGALAGKALLDVGGEPRRVVADLDL